MPIPPADAADLRRKLLDLRHELITQLAACYPDAGTMAMLSHVQSAIAAVDADAVSGVKERYRE